MDKNLTALKPALVWKHFAEIAKIPRPSSHEEKIRAYVIGVAKSLGLECKEDAAHNVYVRKPASKGMENRKGIVLQAHLDMVPQKNNDKKFDFTKDPIEAYIDGEWVTANGTTLGADNGIGAAAILAVLEDDTLEHGPLEALFTATEETGMDGAFGLKKGVLHGDILLNLDSEEEGELYVGCAGGVDANITFKYKAEPTPARNYRAVKLVVKGLKGGHSGIQIVEQRANANKLLFRFIREQKKSMDILLCSVDGGGLRNAIPREATATLMVRTKDLEQLTKELKAYEKVVKAEFAGIEDAVSIKLTETEVRSPEGADRRRRGRQADQSRCGMSRRRAAHVGVDARTGADVEQPGPRGIRRQDGEVAVSAPQFGELREGGAGRGDLRRVRAGRR